MLTLNSSRSKIKKEESKVKPKFKRTLPKQKVLTYLSGELNICIAFYQMKSKFIHLRIRAEKLFFRILTPFANLSVFTKVSVTGKIF
ncbi:hypothetical protein CH380_07550 [Leptospira adleri]|uniref:Uncharacterized protein n=1 Tax=Leptospira adleri TaxID=2023186 RepID=A0A2M9YQP1_9LEPT|nr:hypothetical protein CH380_07550 [Leptospira adleri]PJZ63126.1 hypothetical protein CH376_04575 [Leptospira adleri]